MVFHCLTLDSNSSPSQLLSGASRSHYGASWGHLFFIPDCSHGKSEDLNSLDYHHLGYLTNENMNIKTTRYILQHRNMYSTYQYLPCRALGATRLLSVLFWLEGGQLLSTRLQITGCKTVFSVLMPFSSALFCNKSDLRHVDWVKSYLNIWSELQAYIKEHHTTGLTWSKTVSTSPSGDLSPGHQRVIETLVKTCIPCGLIIVSFRVCLRIGKELYGYSIFLRKP